jgi:hypothetical protein
MSTAIIPGKGNHSCNHKYAIMLLSISGTTQTVILGSKVAMSMQPASIHELYKC